MIRASALALRSMVAIACGVRSGLSWSEPSSLAQPMIAFRGVRNSWETTARNSSFKRLSASASMRNAWAPSASSCSRIELTISCSFISRSCSISARRSSGVSVGVPRGSGGGGPRSSCEMVAKNSSLERFVASASVRAACSRVRSSSRATSARLRPIPIHVAGTARPRNPVSRMIASKRPLSASGDAKSSASENIIRLPAHHNIQPPLVMPASRSPRRARMGRGRASTIALRGSNGLGFVIHPFGRTRQLHQ